MSRKASRERRDSAIIDSRPQVGDHGPKAWKFTGEENKPYIQEHTNLIESIRGGKPINELKNIAESTLTGIMGRMAAYTGKLVTWEQAMNSEENLMPANLNWNGPLPVPPVAMPGQTELR